MSSEQRISHLLTREEIELVTRLLGNKCQVLAMGIVQLYLADGPDYSTWRKHDVGVLCLVKDSQRRSYFFRLYCINRKQMVWEHEVYNSLDYESKRPYFHSFEAEEGIAGFNFASEDEANAVKTALLEKLEAKRQRRQERRNRHSTSGMNQHPHPPIPSMPSGDSDIANGSVPVPTKQIQIGTSNAGKRRKDSKRRLTKADIGLPKDFRHVSHVGWDPNKGFDLDNVEDPQLKQFLFKAGVSNSQMEDKETREFIYDFINRHGGIDAVKEEVVFPSAAHSQSPSVPPPVPARSTPTSTTSHPFQTRSAPPPPPPPSRTGPLPPPPPPSQPPATTGPPPSIQFRPPQANPGSHTSSPAPPPPPAPPAAFNTPPPPPPPPTFSVSDSSPVIPKTPATLAVAQPDSRSALMDAIRSGTPLKHVEVESKRSTSGDSRGDLLDQIRQGVELKSVQHKARPAQSSTPQNGLAGALARALAERSRVIHSDSSGSSDDDEEEDDEWED